MSRCAASREVIRAAVIPRPVLVNRPASRRFRTCEATLVSGKPRTVATCLARPVETTIPPLTALNTVSSLGRQALNEKNSVRRNTELEQDGRTRSRCVPVAYSSSAVVARGVSMPLISLARPERFELPTPRFVVWCSIQLSYGRLVPVGPIARVRNGRIAIGSSRRWQAWPGTRPASCPATVPGIHVLLVGCRKEDVDGRVKPGHDAVDKSKRFGARRAGRGYRPPGPEW
jgi:hypothetical protein